MKYVIPCEGGNPERHWIPGQARNDRLHETYFAIIVNITGSYPMNDNVNFTISKPQNTIESGLSAESRQSQLQFVIHPKVPLFGKEGLGEI